VLVGQITHYLTPSQNCDLFSRIYPALKPKGTLVIDCPMSGNTLSEYVSFLTLFLWANGEGTAYSFEKYNSWLDEIGFQQTQQLNERWLTARR